MRWMWAVTAVLLVGQACCKHGGGASDPEVPDDPQPSETQGAMFRVLSLRDHAPPCAEVEALSPQSAVSDLAWLADNAVMPPWVGMRAANCLVVGHGAEVGDVLLRWVSDPVARGLGLLVLDELEHLPEALAVEVATRAVQQGPDPAAARERIKNDPREAVRAVAAE